MTGLQDLLDCGQETIGVGEHDLVKLLLLFFRGCAALERLQVEPDAGDGSFKFVGDGVEEGVLTFVTTNLADQEDRVKGDASDDERKQDGAEDGEGDGALVDDDPADVEVDEAADQKRAKGDEEGDRSAASGDVHGLVEV